MIVKIPLKKILIDIISLLTLSSIYWFFSLFVNPTRTGFFCNDQTIRYPFIKESYPPLFLFIIGTSVTIIIISVTEIYQSICWRSQKISTYKKYIFYGKYVPNSLVNCYYFFGWYTIGVTSNLVFTKITKLFVGRKRPFFIDICKPSIGYNSCTSNFDYITSYECLGDDKKLIDVIEMSFFSGHASYSFFVAIFLTIYLHFRFFKHNNLKVFIFLIQFFLILYASIISYSRVTEHWHHWSDVLTGIIVGTSFAYIIICKVAEMSYEDSNKNNDELKRKKLY